MSADADDWPALDRRHLWHPYTQMLTAPPPIPIERAEGAHLYTTGGRVIVDAISSWWVTLHGHGDARIAAAIAEQARRLDHVIFAGFTHEPAARLAGRLAEAAPGGLERVFFSDDGSTAVEVALKLALQHWRNLGEPQRERFIAVEGAYHGDTVGAMSVGGVETFQGTFRPLLFDVLRSHNPYLEPDARSSAAPVDEGLATEHMSQLLAAHSGRVAAVIVEPMIQGAGGMLIWTPRFLGDLRALCDQHGALLIADEVFTGFGRSGPLFACEHAGVSPDLLCLSKALTGGTLPLAATLTTEALYESFLSTDRRRTFFHGHSYTANPIACAAANASLDLLCEGGLARVKGIARVHARRLGPLRALACCRRVQHLGLVARLEVTENPASVDDTGYLDAIGPYLYGEFLARDILLRPLGNVLYLLPPLAITDGELERVYDAIEEVLGGLAAAPR